LGRGAGRLITSGKTAVKQQDPVEVNGTATEDQIRRLQAELRSTQRQLSQALTMLEKHESRLAGQDTSIARLDRILMELLTSRIWRTLSAGGKIAKRLLPGRDSEADAEVVQGKGNSFLVCDEPRRGDSKPRSGKVAVRGWALAEGGVDCIQVEVAGLPTVETKPSVPRPDIRKAYSHLDKTGRSGFVAEFDSLALPAGRHPIQIRLVSKGAVVAESRRFVSIDHEKGYASEYQRWIHDFEEPDDELTELKLMSLQNRPLISVLMPVFNTKPEELRAAIQSVIDQSYGNWELCIADDCSAAAHVREILDAFVQSDKRIKVAYRAERGGISGATNSAWDLATGAYLCFLDHDDTLARHALASVCEALDRDPAAELLYSDEDKIDVSGRRSDPYFKPDWSPDLLMSENYICHLLVLNRDLAERTGRLHPEFDGSQDYDLILRASEHAKRIAHIPKILYHWRMSAHSTAARSDNKQYAVEAARKALQSACDRRGAGATIEASHVPGRWRERFPIPAGTRVSIIIASGGKTDVLRDNFSSLFRKTTYRDFEIVVIDNSRQNAIENLVRETARNRPNIRYIDWRNKPFNYSEINNQAARQCDSPVLLFLNDDTSVISDGWLEAMLELAIRPEVGAVGSKLIYPDGRIQHAGVVMGLYDNCGHAFKGLDASKQYYFDLPDVIRNVSAVTGACLMTRSDVFWEIGGFDAEQFAVAFNDIDLCLKIAAKGYRVLYTPHAQLHHHEAFSKTSRDLVPHPEEVAAMRAKWEAVITQDPFYNPNLTRNDEDFSLRTRG
jgi:GT2 family glycosyltransferase